jgi:hypothetical protein
MSAARKLSIVEGKLNQELIGEVHYYKIDSDEFEFVYKNGSLKFKRAGDQLIIDRSEIWSSEIPVFQLPAQGPLEITALFDAGSVELQINGLTATALLDVDDELPELRIN